MDYLELQTSFINKKFDTYSNEEIIKICNHLITNYKESILYGTMEEIGELIQAVMKYLRYSKDESKISKLQIMEEIADVYICLTCIVCGIKEMDFDESKRKINNTYWVSKDSIKCTMNYRFDRLFNKINNIVIYYLLNDFNDNPNIDELYFDDLTINCIYILFTISDLLEINMNDFNDILYIKLNRLVKRHNILL